jgi:Polyketide cyclase / dehydrase and lipid transport
MSFDFGTLALTEPVGSLREHVLISAAPQVVWNRVSDVANHSSWFISIEASSCQADPITGRPIRLVKSRNGATLTEDIIRVDSIQRRIQYKLRPFAFITHHLATVDVIDTTTLTGSPSSMVIYSTELTPATLAIAFGAASRDALDALKQQIESNESEH